MFLKEYSKWIGLLAYPFFLCLVLNSQGQSARTLDLLNLALQPGEAPQKARTNTDLQEIYTQNLHDFVYLIFHESDSAYEALKPLEDQRLKAISKASDQSAWKGFVEAELKLQWGFLKLKYGDEWGAFWAIRSANKSIERNLKAHPDFQLNHRTRGLLQILFGVTPENYRWVFNLFGMRGTVNDGLNQLKQVPNTHSMQSLESAIILGMVYSHLLENFSMAPSFIANHKWSNTPLASYFQGIIMAKSHRAEEARQLFYQVRSKVPFAAYLLGETYFQQGKYTEAIDHFSSFIQSFKGASYQKDALLKMGLSAKFMNRPSEFNHYIRQAKEKGSSGTEIDKNAEKILENLGQTHWPMLQLRFAIDGGFYEFSQSLIESIEREPLTELLQVELTYRKARMAHLQNRSKTAIELYRAVIDKAEMIEESYYAPNAFLQLGYLQQQQGQNTMAKMYFERVLSFKKHPYKSSLDSKASLALSQLSPSND
ncbi:MULTISPECIES: tetratricopeptide repeat protein [Roseivirga]|uniref:tetratricopeptide repeat protein n=1 Tax=Roseivirga TaxID=290180 RepID=UPI00257C0DD3|nr:MULTISPECIES: tetratricopeptide repeat protein [Roseivirga]|tara:strand:+ start:10905 stop:12353 length:1449 start_codon:yes stop_codon:yes gene_type:complete